MGPVHGIGYHPDPSLSDPDAVTRVDGPVILDDRHAAMAIRPGRPSDAEALARVHRDSALAAYRDIFPGDAPKPTVAGLTAAWREVLTDDDGAVLVATGHGRPVGGVALTRSTTNPDRFLLGRLYVDPDRWGQGLGAALYDAALELARSVGATVLELWVLEENRRARAMYERRGWVLVPGRTLRHPDGPMEVGYELVLDPAGGP